jgi:hypothetical protein
MEFPGMASDRLLQESQIEQHNSVIPVLRPGHARIHHRIQLLSLGLRRLDRAAALPRRGVLPRHECRWEPLPEPLPPHPHHGLLLRPRILHPLLRVLGLQVSLCDGDHLRRVGYVHLLSRDIGPAPGRPAAFAVVRGAGAPDPAARARGLHRRSQGNMIMYHNNRHNNTQLY